MSSQIDQFYRQYLGRERNPDETFWHNQLSSGAMDLDAISRGIVGSQEYQNIAAQDDDPFIYVNNGRSSRPVLGNNPNSAIQFEHNVGGGTGVSRVSGPGFDPFNVGTPNPGRSSNSSGGGGGGGGGVNAGVMPLPQQQAFDPMAGFSSFLEQMQNQYSGMMDAFQQSNQSMLDQFYNLSQQPTPTPTQGATPQVPTFAPWGGGSPVYSPYAAGGGPSNGQNTGWAGQSPYRTF